MKTLLSLVLSTALLVGCTSGGMSFGGNSDKLSHDYVTQHLIVGKTTKSDVKRDFGDPESGRIRYSSNGTESWYYSVDKGFDIMGAAASLVPIPGANSAASIVSSQDKKDTNSLMIWFDKDGIVRSWSR